jgi:hypothetical protein
MKKKSRIQGKMFLRKARYIKESFFVEHSKMLLLFFNNTFLRRRTGEILKLPDVLVFFPWFSST